MDALRRGDARAAWDCSLRQFRLADHLYQQPAWLDTQLARRVQARAVSQLLYFLMRHQPAEPPRLRAGVLAITQNACPDDVREAVETLFALDWAERVYAWAADPAAEPRLEETLRFLCEPRDELIASALGERTFTSLTELQQALRQSSFERGWESLLAVEAAYARWNARPFADALRDVDAFRREVLELRKQDPLTQLEGLNRPEGLRLSGATASTQRHAAAAVLEILAFERRTGRLPETFAELGAAQPADARTDPFAGADLRYVREGPERFRLYSVGPDQCDDGGRHNGFERREGDWVYWPPAPLRRASATEHGDGVPLPATSAPTARP